MAKIEDSLTGDVVAEDVLESYTTETPADTTPKAPRAILNVPGAAVGRRKEAVSYTHLDVYKRQA